MPNPDRFSKLDLQESIHIVEDELGKTFRTGVSPDDVSYIRKRERKIMANELLLYYTQKFKESEENDHWPPFSNTVFGKLHEIADQK